MTRIDPAQVGEILRNAPASGTVHLIGAGGCGVSGLAHLLLDIGFRVSGSDLSANEDVESLRRRGANIAVGHAAANVSAAQPFLVIYSSAVRLDNPEILAAQQLQVPIARRAKRGHQVARRSALSKLDERVAQLEALVAQVERRARFAGDERRFHAALGLSLFVHVLVITLVTFTLPKPPEMPPPTMEVVLVNAKPKAPPKKASAYAQHNLDGGGNTDADRRARSPLPALRDDPRMSDVAIAQKRVEQLEERARPEQVQVRRVRVALREARAVGPTALPRAVQAAEAPFEVGPRAPQVVDGVQHTGMHDHQHGEGDERDHEPEIGRAHV